MSKPDSLSASRMGTQPLAPLLASLAVPMMISMLVQALYNIVDSIFVSRINEAALSAVSLAFPIQNLMIAFAVGTGIGVNAYLSKSLGEGNPEEANRAAANGLFLSVCSFVAFLLFGLFGVKAFMYAQTTDPVIRQYGVDYLTVCCVFSLGCFVQCMLEKILVATGRSTFSMLTQLIGAITNIVLDPIFIFGLCGMPKLGVTGAAVATVIGQWLGAVAGFAINHFFNKDLHLTLRGFCPNLRTIRRIYQVGVPSIAMNAIGSVMTFCMNAILIGFSSTAVAVFGVYFKLQSFVFMPVFGLNNGMVPIISYNYGARSPRRITGVVKLGVAVAGSIMLVGLAVAELFPTALLQLFEAGDNMLAMGTVALRIIALHFPIAAVGIIFSATLQAMGRAYLSMIGSLVRQLVVLIPVAWLLSLSGNVDLIWWCFPIAESVSVLILTISVARCYKTVIKPMYAESTV